MKDRQKSAKPATALEEPSGGFTEVERAAMQERAREVKAARRGPRAAKADGESAVLARIAEMSESDRALGE
ncbi:MAG TPA: hypothetical protein VHS99_06715, partial [Chloroflexota bacterium]|nr:hypothetical protein [Chloroflexota bacterium]